MLLKIIMLWFGALWSFVAIMHAKQALEAGRLSLFWKVNLSPLAAIAWVLDFLFNVLLGTVMFLERPKEKLFTDRCKRHKEGGAGWRRSLAEWWCANLNVMDPGHC